MPYHLAMAQYYRAANPREDLPLFLNGVGDGTRTHDARNHNPVLYQLNYTHHIKMVRPKGLEPLAHCLEGSCSIHLSYGREQNPLSGRCFVILQYSPRICQEYFTKKRRMPCISFLSVIK